MVCARSLEYKYESLFAPRPHLSLLTLWLGKALYVLMLYFTYANLTLWLVAE